MDDSTMCLLLGLPNKRALAEKRLQARDRIVDVISRASEEAPRPSPTARYLTGVAAEIFSDNAEYAQHIEAGVFGDVDDDLSPIRNSGL